MATDNTKITRNTIEKLWTKIKNTFATKSDVEKIISSQSSIQSCIDGLVFTPSSDNNTTLIVLVNKLDDYGRPAISKPKFNTLYLAPTSESNAGNVVWSEWICVDDPQKSKGYSWKKIGTISIDLTWINDELDKIRNDKSQMYSELNNDIIELQNYIVSDKFISDIFNIAPTATETENGLMSSDTVKSLNDLMIWASNYTDVENGGELTEAEVTDAFETYFNSSDSDSD